MNDDFNPLSNPFSAIAGYYSPNDTGLLDPATSDGRVIFFLPWQKSTIAGTTDKPCKVDFNISPTEADIQFILNEIKKYLNPDVNVRRGDVMSAWSGIRPLVIDPSKKDTQSIARNHIIEESESGLITIAGGKVRLESKQIPNFGMLSKNCLFTFQKRLTELIYASLPCKVDYLSIDG